MPYPVLGVSDASISGFSEEQWNFTFSLLTHFITRAVAKIACLAELEFVSRDDSLALGRNRACICIRCRPMGVRVPAQLRNFGDWYREALFDVTSPRLRFSSIKQVQPIDQSMR